MSNHKVIKSQAQRKVQLHPKNEQGDSSRCQSTAARDPELLDSASSGCHTLLVQDQTLHLGLDRSGRSGEAVSSHATIEGLPQ